MIVDETIPTVLSLCSWDQCRPSPKSWVTPKCAQRVRPSAKSALLFSCQLPGVHMAWSYTNTLHMSQYLFYICFIKHSHSVDRLWSMYRPLFFDTWELLSPLQCVHTYSFEVHGVIIRQITGWHYALYCYFPHFLFCYLRPATFSLTLKGSWNWPNWLVPRFRGTAANKCCKLYPGLIKKHFLILPFKSVRIQFQATMKNPSEVFGLCAPSA